MQLPSKINKGRGKQHSCHSNGLKCIAACRDCQGTECQNCLTGELFEEEENNVEYEFDNNIFDNVWLTIFHNCL